MYESRKETVLVSVITPAFNCEKTIEETYQSIKNQSFSSWEWIVIEDHSNDHSFSLLQTLASADDRIVLLRTETNSGAAVARNLGIQRAVGRYIAFLDADDLWDPNKLSHQISFMEESQIAFSFTNYNVLSSDGETKHERVKKDRLDYRMLLKRNYIGCSTVIYDSSKSGKVFMPEDCEKREDHGMWLDLTRMGVAAYRLDEYLATYRLSNNSVSSKKIKMIRYQYRLYRKHEKFGPMKSFYYLILVILKKIFRP
ncbi:MAG: glycosyltransferase family 2 protein [Candidatus Enteromonas sp.]